MNSLSPHCGRHSSIRSWRNTLLIAGFLPVGFSASAQSVVANFGQGANFPLVKKFDWMNSRYLDPNRYGTTPGVDDLKAAGAKTIRIELGWGAGGSYTNEIGGSSGNLTYNFTPVDNIANQLHSRNMGAYWSYAYNPPALGSSFATPSDLNQWKGILQTMATHWKNNGLRPDFQGVWNEPDNSPNFYTGTLQSYKGIYEYGSKGLRAGDADATVGGVDLAVGDSWLTDLLGHIVNTSCPMDYLSFHSLGADQETRVAPKRTALKANSYFNQTEMVIGELNPFSTTTYESGSMTACSAYPSGAAAVNCISYYLQVPEVTRTFWAQGEGAGDNDQLAAITYTGSHRRPVYWAFQFFNQMPVDRVATTTSSVNAMASTDAHTSAILIWNPAGGGTKNVSATFQNVPFSSGSLAVSRIDSTHNAYGNTGHDYDAPQVVSVSNTQSYVWSGSVPDGGTVLLKMYDNSGISELAPYHMGTMIRQHHYFYNRGDKSYGIFDRDTWITRLGMAGNDYAVVEEGALYKNLPASLSFNVQTDGNPHALDSNSVLSVNVDYRVNGVYTKSVMFHGALYNSARTSGHPFGKTGLPGQVVAVSFPNFAINLASYAPSGWSVGGDALISYTMQNTGANSRAKITVSATTQTLEAENAALSGAIVANDYPGYTGTGYVDYQNASGDSITWTANVAAAGSYDLTFRYASIADRPLQLMVNGTVVSASRSFPSTGAWTTWGTVTNTVNLNAGNNTIKLTSTGSSGGNIDNVTIALH